METPKGFVSNPTNAELHPLTPEEIGKGYHQRAMSGLVLTRRGYEEVTESAETEQKPDFGEHQKLYEKFNAEINKTMLNSFKNHIETVNKTRAKENETRPEGEKHELVPTPTLEQLQEILIKSFNTIIENGSINFIKSEIEAGKHFRASSFINQELTAAERSASNAAINPNMNDEWSKRSTNWSNEELNTTVNNGEQFAFAFISDEYTFDKADSNTQRERYEQAKQTAPSLVIPKDNINLARERQLVDEGVVDINGKKTNFDITYVRYDDLSAVGGDRPVVYVYGDGYANLVWLNVGFGYGSRLAVVA